MLFQFMYRKLLACYMFNSDSKYLSEEKRLENNVWNNQKLKHDGKIKPTDVKIGQLDFWLEIPQVIYRVQPNFINIYRSITKVYKTLKVNQICFQGDKLIKY